MKWSRASGLGSAPPVDSWPEFDYSGLCPEDQEFIQNREAAVRMVLAGKTYAAIEKATGVDKNAVRKLASVCLALSNDGRIMGFRGLLPFTRLDSNVRRNPIGPKRRQQQGGMSCALQDTLARFPDLPKQLIAHVRKEKKDGLIPESNIKGVTLHRIFLGELKRRGVAEDQWPFATEYKGKRSIVTFMREILDGNFEKAVRARGGNDAKAHLATGSGDQRIIPFAQPYDAVEIDAHYIDALFTVAFKTPDGAETEAVLERLWLIAAVERMSTAVLAYRIVYRTEITAVDVAGVIRDAICKRWIKKELTIPGLEYPPGGGFPSGVIPEAAGALWTVTMLDGALAHLSNLIHDTLRKATGFVVNWGPPGHFERRPNIERTFKRITDDLFLRLPSTTGSNPHTGREAEAAENAKKYHIRADDMHQLVDVVFAQHNGLPGQGNFYRSPLETLRFFLTGSTPHTMLRRLPFWETTRARQLHRRETCVVRGGVASGRRPYVQFENAQYTSPLLSQSARLVGTPLTIYVDDEDLRTVRAFTSNGLDIGILSAKGGWNLTKHDLSTRKAIFQLVSKRILVLSQTGDPVQAYLRYLAEQLQRSRKSGKVSAKDLTDLARVSKNADAIPTLPNSNVARYPAPDPAQLADKSRRLLAPPLDRQYKVRNR
jgi:hypothetical protein